MVIVVTTKLFQTAREMFRTEHRCARKHVAPEVGSFDSYLVVRCVCGYVTSFEVTTVASVMRRATSNDNGTLVSEVRSIVEPEQRQRPRRQPRFTWAA